MGLEANARHINIITFIRRRLFSHSNLCRKAFFSSAFAVGAMRVAANISSLHYPSNTFGMGLNNNIFFHFFGASSLRVYAPKTHSTHTHIRAQWMQKAIWMRNAPCVYGVHWIANRGRMCVFAPHQINIIVNARRRQTVNGHTVFSTTSISNASINSIVFGF